MPATKLHCRKFWVEKAYTVHYWTIMDRDRKRVIWLNRIETAAFWSLVTTVVVVVALMVLYL